MGRRLVIVLDPWFGLVPDKPKAPARFGPIPMVDADGQPLSAEMREESLAKMVYGSMSLVEIARYIRHLDDELEKAKYAAELPGWYLLALLVAGGYVGVSAYVGEPMAVWIIRGAVALYLLSVAWAIVLNYRSKKWAGR